MIRATIITIMAATLTATGARAQMARWIIPPAYSAIHKMSGGDFLLTDSADMTILWSWDGKRLAATSDQLSSFSEQMAVTIRKGTNGISGFYDTDGHFTSLPDGLTTALGFPYFSSGYLLVKQGQYYRYVNRQGNVLNGQYVVAYPYSNGYATCYTYRNLEKQKDPYYLLLDAEGHEVPLSYNGKTFGDNEVEFISSVNDEGVGFVVAARKLYRFSGKSRTLTPVLARSSETDLRNQARLDRSMATCLVRQNDTTTVLTASCGTSGNVYIWFDNRLIAKSIQTQDGQKHYSKTRHAQRSYATPLRVLREDGKMGLYWDTTELLPPQLDQVTTCYADIAFVRQDNRYGAIKAYSDGGFNISINDGKPVAFRHRTQSATVTVTMPEGIPVGEARLIVPRDAGLDIDPGSVSRGDDGTLRYEGLLYMPESLTDRFYDDGSQNETSYPLSVSYDGLLSPVIDVKVKALHEEYHTISVDPKSITVSTDGQLQFLFTVTADTVPGEEPTPVDVSLQADGLQWNVEQLSDTKYRGIVNDLYDGDNTITVKVEEQGCPPLFHRFSANYKKPVEKKSKPRPAKTTPKSDDKGKTKPKHETPIKPVLEI